MKTHKMDGQDHHHTSLRAVRTLKYDTNTRGGTRQPIHHFDDFNRFIVEDRNGVIRLHELETSRCNMWGDLQKGCINAKVSPDELCLAVQQQPGTVDVYSSTTRSVICSIKGKASSSGGGPSMENSITAYHWVQNEFCDIFIVSMGGVEFFKINYGKGVAKSVKTILQPGGCSVYSPFYRVLLLPGTTSLSQLQALKVGSSGLVKLPKIELSEPIAADPGVMPNVFVLRLYDLLYCVHVHKASPRMDIYQLGTDYILKRFSVDLFSPGKCILSAVDNLLLVHNTHTKVIMIYDVRTSNVDYPISAPLPLSASVDMSYLQSHGSGDQLPGIEEEQELGIKTEQDLYVSHWSFHYPHFIMDGIRGEIYDLVFDLNKIAESCFDKNLLVEFLLNRTNSKHLVLDAARQMVGTRRSIMDISVLFHSINSFVAHQELVSQQQLQQVQNRPASASSAASPSTGSDRSSSSWFKSPFKSMSTRPEEESPQKGASSRQSWKKTMTARPLSGAMNNIASVFKTVVEPGTTGKKDKDGADLAWRTRNLFVTEERHPCIVTQTDLFAEVLYPLSQERSTAGKYLVTVVSEYIRSLNMFGVPLDNSICELLIDLMAMNKMYYQLHQTVQYHVVGDSIPVAMKLLAMQKIYPPAGQLGQDMLARLGTYDVIVDSLLERGDVILALQLASQQEISNLPVKRFLDVAKNTKNSAIVSTVVNFFEKGSATNQEYRVALVRFKEKSVSEGSSAHKAAWLGQQPPQNMTVS